MAFERPFVLSVLLAQSVVSACHESPPPSTVAPGTSAVATANATPPPSNAESGDGGAKVAPPPGEQQACSPESRHAEACTMIYAPVCAVVDTGIRCIAAPCPSTKLVNVSNACSACKDKSTLGYYLGECVTSGH